MDKLYRLLRRPSGTRLVHPMQIIDAAAERDANRLLITAGYAPLPDGYWTQTRRTAVWLEAIDAELAAGRPIDEPSTKLRDVAVVTEIAHPIQIVAAAAMSAAIRDLINAGCMRRPDGYWTPTADTADWLDSIEADVHEDPSHESHTTPTISRLATGRGHHQSPARPSGL